MSNQDIIKQMFNDFENGNIPAVLSLFSSDIQFIRPGAPYIPFSGTFSGTQEVVNMFQLQNQNLKMKSFVPQKICACDDQVIVTGHDEAEVVPTGKSYSADWVQVYTLRDNKIVKVQVFMDTKMIADAFTKD